VYCRRRCRIVQCDDDGSANPIYFRDIICWLMAARRNRPKPLHRKPKHEDSERLFHYSFYCVGYLDLVGQRRKLLQLGPVPRKDEETTRILRETAGTVIRLREELDDCFEGFGKPTIYLEGLPPDAKRRILSARRSVNTRSISDSIIMEVSFRGDEDQCSSMIGVFGCVAACCILQLLGLVTKAPIRGGIDVGLGLDISERGNPEVYGPVLGNAYKLESELAEYPRILVGDELLKYLEQTARMPQMPGTPLTPLGRLASKLAVDCKRFITEDADGKSMLDFLGAKMVEFSPHEDRATQFIRINECITEQKQKAESENDAKLLARYNRLSDYVSKRAAIWNP
jgi:hypothetical protein